jgi:tetratricopeptide (TPR) repeat protein
VTPPALGLAFETRSSSVYLNGRRLDLDLRQQRLLGVVAERFLSTGSSTDVGEFRRAQGWAHLEAAPLKNAASRLLMRLNEVQAPVICHAPREKTKRWAIDQRVVLALWHDLATPAAFAEWIYGPPREASLPAELEAARLLVLAQTAFEQGRFSDAERLAAAVLAEPSTPDQQLRALALLAWIRTVCDDYAQGEAAVQRLQRRLAAGPAPSPEVEALVWIQTARFYLRKLQAPQARAAYTRAARLLSAEHHREWGAIESGLGYLGQQAGSLQAAARHYRLALDHFTRGQWPWAMHVQYNNLAAIHFLLHAAPRGRAAVGRAHLHSAVQWSLQAREFAESMDFGGAVDLEVNLAYAYRLLGRLDDAREELRKASNVARASASLTDRACVLAEQAELDEALGRRSEAAETLRAATILLRQIGNTDWTQAAEQRLAELEGRVPLTRPLKLW